ncbi:MAG: hypothetical protein ACN4GM_01995 [Gammaproteobacteria bacterium]
MGRITEIIFVFIRLLSSMYSKTVVFPILEQHRLVTNWCANGVKMAIVIYTTIMSKESENYRINIRSTSEVCAFLDQIIDIGIYGKTRSEVAKSLIAIEIERFIREGLITVKINK